MIEIRERDERLRICRLMIAMAKMINADIFGPGSNFGAELDTIYIACAVLVGHAERRPMTANKIALFLGMPRTTVLRKLRRLLKLDIVVEKERKYFVSPQRLANDEQVVAKLSAAIAKAV